MNIFLRRRKLGRTSTREVGKHAGIIPFRNDKPLPESINYLFRWGCTSPCEAKHTVNKAEAINIANNKRTSRMLLQEVLWKGKHIVPESWEHVMDWDEPEHWGFKPVVIRPAHHAQGKQLYFCDTRETAFKAIETITNKGKDYYISEYIEKEKEFRVFVAQNRVIWIAEKTPANPEAIAWNVAQGGKFDVLNRSNWPLKACRYALLAMEKLGLDFGGVDIMQKGKDFYVLEVNSAPSMTSPYRQETTAKVFKHIIDNGNKHYPTPEFINSYKDCIHPCLI